MKETKQDLMKKINKKVSDGQNKKDMVGAHDEDAFIMEFLNKGSDIIKNNNNDESIGKLDSLKTTLVNDLRKCNNYVKDADVEVMIDDEGTIVNISSVKINYTDGNQRTVDWTVMILRS